MAHVVLVGADSALLEGIAQTLVGSGHQVSFAGTVSEISLAGDAPGLIVVSTEALDNAGHATSLLLSTGSALIVYGPSYAERPFLSPSMQRSTLAYLVLPLERHRLVALAHSFDNRSRHIGSATREEREEDTEFLL